MGCGASVEAYSSEAEDELRRTAIAFRAKVIREVERNILKANQADFSMGTTPTMTALASSSSYLKGGKQPLGISLMGELGAADEDSDGDVDSMLPLRSNAHVDSTGDGGGKKLVGMEGDICVSVAGKVGCEDDKVVISGADNAHKLLRTRRVHKYKGAAKKVWAHRALRNLEDEVQDNVEEPRCDSLSEAERRALFKVMQRHFLTASLQKEEHEQLIEQVVRLEMDKGEAICKQGQTGDSCFIIISGICAVETTKSEQTVAQLTAGDVFGELAMLYDVPRTATIVVYSQSVVMAKIRGPSFRRCLARFKERTLNETLEFLNGHDIFSKLTLQEKRVFAGALTPQFFEVGAMLIDANISHTADWMFLIQEGSVEVTDQYKNRTVLGEGATFAGQRMPYGQRAVAAKALSRLRLLAIGHNVMQKLFGNISEIVRRAHIQSYLEEVPIFSELTDKQQMIMAALFQEQQFKKGEVVVTAAADPQLVLVMEGEVLVVDPTVSSEDCAANLPDSAPDAGGAGTGDAPTDRYNEPEVEVPHCEDLQKTPAKEKEERSDVARILGSGDLYGVGTFRENSCMEHSLICRTDSLVARVGHDEVCRALRGVAEKTPPLRTIILRNKVKACLQKIFPLSSLCEDVLDVVVEAFKTVEYPGQGKIVAAGDTSRRFGLVVEGEALCRQGSSLEPLASWDHFGLLPMLIDRTVDVDITAAATGCTIKEIDVTRFKEACGVLFEESAKKMLYQDMKLHLGEIVNLKRLGEGQFGVVRKVCVRKIVDESFALKRIFKAKVLETNQQDPVRLEKEILQDCCHPLIVRLITTFQDEHSVYLLMENLAGNDLFTAIRDIGSLSEEHSLFFGASLTLAIEYLHTRGVIYRDLKPENVMLTEQGFVKMVDMGCCSKKVRSYTFVGTIEYMAPEAVLGRGYGQSVDWWAVGVILYELICGPLPFGETCTDPLDVMREIVEKPLEIPAKVPAEASDLITCLLERMPEQRLGSSTKGQQSEVRSHPFFENVNWDAILEMRALPPYTPPKLECQKSPFRAAQEESDEDELPDPLPANADLSCFEGF